MAAAASATAHEEVEARRLGREPSREGGDGPLLPDDLVFGRDLLFWVLWFLAAMSYLTAAQRFRSAHDLLRGAER